MKKLRKIIQEEEADQEEDVMEYLANSRPQLKHREESYLSAFGDESYVSAARDTSIVEPEDLEKR